MTDFNNNHKSSSPPNVCDLLGSTKEIKEYKRLVLKDVKEVLEKLENESNLNVDEIITLEKNILNDLNSTYDNDIRQTIVTSIQKISEKILEVAEQNLTSTRSDYPVMNITYALIRLDKLDEKMIFWVNSINKQKRLLEDLLKENIDKVSEQRICKTLLNYCDILVSVFEKEIKNNENNYEVDSDISGVKLVLKETRDLKTNVLIRLKKMRDISNASVDKKRTSDFFNTIIKEDEKLTEYKT